MKIFVNLREWIVVAFLLLPQSQDAHHLILADGAEIIMVIYWRQIVLQRRVHRRQIGSRSHMNLVRAKRNHRRGGGTFKWGEQRDAPKLLSQQMDETQGGLGVSTI